MPRLFVFTHETAEPVVDFATGLSIQPSYAVAAETYEYALGKLAAHCHAYLDCSDDPADYQDDIDNGNWSVTLPVTGLCGLLDNLPDKM